MGCVNIHLSRFGKFFSFLQIWIVYAHISRAFVRVFNLPSCRFPLMTLRGHLLSGRPSWCGWVGLITQAGAAPVPLFAL